MKKYKTKDIERMLNVHCEFHISDGFKEKTMKKAANETATSSQHTSLASRSLWRLAFSGLALTVIVAALMLTPGTIPAYAAQKIFAKASEYFNKAEGYRMSLKVRTRTHDNFAYTNPLNSFLEHEMTVTDDGRWKLVKTGRSAEFDGDNMWVWFPDKGWGWKFDEYMQADILEQFYPLLDLKGLLNFLESYAVSRDDIKIRKKEKDGKIYLSMKVPAIGNFTDSNYARSSSVVESDTRQTYVFDLASGRLESLHIDMLLFGFMPRTIIRLEAIQYGSAIAGTTFGIPSEIEWIDETDEGIARKASLLPFHEFQGISAKEAVDKMFSAMQEWDKERLGVVLGTYPLTILEKKYSGCRMIECGEAFTSGTYAGVFVPCKVQYADGSREKLKISLRNDNRYGVWTVDGGI